MSGAEALAAVGLVSNILQFVDFTSQLCVQIKEIASSASGLPKELDRQATQLAELLALLRDLAQDAKGHALGEGVLQQCQAQAQELAVLLKSFDGGSGKGHWKNAKVAFRSMRHNKEVEKLQGSLDRLVNLLSLQLQIEAKRAADRTGSDISEVLTSQHGQLSLLLRLQDFNISRSLTPEPTKPVWMVPISRNPNFVGREDALNRLEDVLSGKEGYFATAALYGLGGIGKSQITLEYIYRHRSDDTAVFWVYASNASRFVESYKRIASECEIPNRNDPNSDTLQLVHDWLEARYRFKWLMVVDSIDDRPMFFELNEQSATEKPLIEYIPQTEKGSIIYTTRSRDIAIDLSPDNDPIAIPSLSLKEAQSLLGQKIVDASTEEDQISLFLELDYLPLAISQAAAFITKRRKQVADYLKMLGDETTKSQLLSQKGFHHGRADRSSESIFNTWWITFQSVQRENARAAELLMMMSLLDRQEIPIAILREENESKFDFEEAIAMLEAYSLIFTYSEEEPCDQQLLKLPDQATYNGIDGGLEFCDMHRLVQESSQAWLSQPGKNALEIASKSLRSIVGSFPSGFFETWPLCDLLYPHADAILKYNFDKFTNWHDVRRDCPSNLPDRARLLFRTSTYLREQGSLKHSERNALLSMQMRETHLGKYNADTLDSMESYSLTLNGLGRDEEAVELQRQVLAGREEVFGKDHRWTLEALNGLGTTLRSLSHFAEAEALHRRELAGKRHLYAENPTDEYLESELIIAIDNLAAVLKDQAEYEDAMELLSEALERSERLYGTNHLNCWNTMESLAICYGELERYDEAHKLFSTVLAGRRKLFGPLHPSTLITRGQYKTLFRAEGRYEEAEEMASALCEDKLQVYGAKTDHYINSLHNLCFLQYLQKKYVECESSLRRLLEIQIELSQGDSKFTKPKYHYGGIKPDIKISREMIRRCLEGQGRTAEALAFEMDHKLEPPSRVNSELSDTEATEVARLRRKGREQFDNEHYQAAEETFKQELDLRLNEAGLDDDETQATRHDIARSIHEQRRYAEAQELAQDILAWRKRVQGWRNGRTHDILRFIAAATRDEGRLEESEKLWRQLILWQEYSWGKNNVQTYEAHWGLANVMSKQGKVEAAEQCYRKMLEIQYEHPLDSDPEATAQILHDLGCVLFNQGKSDEAEIIGRQAFERRTELFGKYDGRTIRTGFTVADALVDQLKWDEADALYLELCEAKALPAGDDAEEIENGTNEDDEDEVDSEQYDDESGTGEEFDQESSADQDVGGENANKEKPTEQTVIPPASNVANHTNRPIESSATEDQQEGSNASIKQPDTGAQVSSVPKHDI